MMEGCYLTHALDVLWVEPCTTCYNCVYASRIFHVQGLESKGRLLYWAQPEMLAVRASRCQVLLFVFIITRFWASVALAVSLLSSCEQKAPLPKLAWPKCILQCVLQGQF